MKIRISDIQTTDIDTLTQDINKSYDGTEIECTIYLNNPEELIALIKQLKIT